MTGSSAVVQYRLVAALAAAIAFAGCGGSNPGAAPLVPTGLIATGSSHQISLTWNAVPSATGYLVLRGDAAGAARSSIASPPGNSYVDTGLGAGATRFYSVRAVGPGGTSADSAEASATTRLTPSPTGLVATGGNKSIALAWNAVPEATGYVVLRGEASNGPRTSIAAPATNAFTDSGLQPSTSWFYAVRAIGTDGTSPDSVQASATALSTPAPSGLAATTANASVLLRWDAVDGATSYKVFRASGGEGPVQVAIVATPGYSDSLVQNGVHYQYTVRAVDPQGDSEVSLPVAATPFRELCVTDAVTDRVLVFNAEQSGDVAPSRSFGSLTGLDPFSIALDATRDEVFSANLELGTVTVHPRAANGNAAPLRTLAATGARAVAYDAQDDRILVGTDRIQAFDRAASGAGALPLRTLAMPFGTADQIVLSGVAHGDRMFVRVGQGILIYGRTDAGNSPPLATIFLIDPVLNAIAYDPVSDEILAAVRQPDGSAAVLAFPASSDGSTVPSRVLAGDQTLLQTASGLAVDGRSGILYVVDSGGAVLAFARDFAASANVAPVRVLRGPSTQLSAGDPRDARDVLVDEARDLLVVRNAHRILVFDANASGDTAPLSAVSAASTGLETPGGISADAANGELFVATQGSAPAVSTYDRIAQGDVVPLRTIDNRNGGIVSSDLVLDAAHSELIVAPGNLPRVQIFARDASGLAAPLRTIEGPQTLLGHAGAVALDTLHDAIVVRDDFTIRRFARSFSDGNEAPLSTIAGPHTGLEQPVGLDVDRLNGEIVVADTQNVLVFALDADGDAPPLRSLNAIGARGVLVDPVAGELFVIEGSVIEVYTRLASGNAAPLRTIRGPSTGLVFATRSAVCN